MPGTSEVVTIVEFGPYKVYKPAGAEPLKFRVEILRSGKAKFFARIYRREVFRLQPSFPQAKRKPITNTFADLEMFVVDDFLAPDEIRGKSSKEVLDQVKASIKRTFGRI